ncbi:diguanylate cyclase (GGDEF)-like protein [Litorivivens lipolytica]|uniref:diguanylate cyclase n=1 Tax=Litorivivens lipolytica TaxID=1524264 RepID=A0A7W4W6X7_9GAMM|nr:GGDEF domain-containing protein [Litorivivens lipolytica]MBB3048608.1 diguanylate cyclase (GGDEF)-like protein [Litorivivens lipolytica]
MPSLGIDPTMQGVGDRRATPVGRIVRRRMGEVYRARFNAEDEERFKVYCDESRAVFRIIFMLAGSALALGLLAIDYFLPGLPADFLQMRERQVFGVMVPLPLLAAASAYLPRFRRHSEMLVTVTVAASSLMLIIQRYIGASLGLDVPLALIALPIFIGLLLCRVRWNMMLPSLVGTYLLTVITELAIRQPTVEASAYLYSYTLLVITFAGGAWVVEVQNRLTWLRRDYLRRLSSIDPLTGLLNKRAFNREYQRLYSLAQREQRPLCVVLLDLDHFKAYNDHYGHPEGDRCLKQITELLQTQTRRASDIVARVGGEEFAVVWFGLEKNSATNMVNALLEDIRRLNIPHAKTGTGANRVTASAGARWLLPQRQSSPAALLHEADVLLYAAKNTGRDTFKLD